MNTALIVEDDEALAASYAAILQRAGIGADIASTITTAERQMQARLPDVIVMDLGLPDGDGMDFIRALQTANKSPQIIVVSGDGSITRAVEATRLGAYDFLTKPINASKFTQIICEAIRASQHTHFKATEPTDNLGLIGSSDIMIKLRQRLRRVAKSGAAAFITGESGVGKELCARAIHTASARASGPFVALNCGAIPGDLLESEMFGHLRGSFTGAVVDKPGAAAEADGGALFLDEICEMDIRLQTKLLRFLETSSVRPVGAAHPYKVDVRIICATNRDPRAETAAGRFREDLFYRLFVLPIHVPPLRERGSDVLEIAEHILSASAIEEDMPRPEFTNAARMAIRSADWPGNVRELRNVIQQALVLGESNEIDTALLNISVNDLERAQASAAAKLCHLPLSTIEQLIIDAAITAYGSLPKAARSLGLSPSTLYRRQEARVKTP